MGCTNRFLVFLRKKPFKTQKLKFQIFRFFRKKTFKIFSLTITAENVAFQSCVYSYAILHMAINDMWQQKGCVVCCEFLGHYFVSGLRTIKPKKPLKNLKPKNLKTFSKNLGFSSPVRYNRQVYGILQCVYRTVQLVRCILSVKMYREMFVGLAVIRQLRCSLVGRLLGQVKETNMSFLNT